MKRIMLFWMTIWGLWTTTAQTGRMVHPNVVKYPIGFKVIESLRDKPVVTDFSFDNEEFYLNRHEERRIKYDLPRPRFDSIYAYDPFRLRARPAEVQTVQPNIVRHFGGQNTGAFPPDANGDVNDDYYFQVVNTTYAIYDKEGNIVAGPTDLNEIFADDLPGAGNNDGDPIVLWDEQAQKWFYAEFSISGNNDYMLIAVSQTADPTGAWWSWSFDVDDMPDYMKFGIWQDGYYMATNTSDGNDVYVFDRNAMIRGDENPVMIGFDNPDRPSTFDGFHCIMPLDNDGEWAPDGTPGQFITIVDDDQGNDADQLWIYTLNADWDNPSNSTFGLSQTLDVPAFTGYFNNSWDNIPQPGTDQKLDALSTVLMYRAVYRNFNGDQRLVVAHTIAQSEDEGAIRWYELQNDGNGWGIRQGGEVDLDGTSCWLPSIAINANKEIAIGYSVSDADNTYPGIRIIGQTQQENNNASGILDVEATVVWDGEYAQENYNRWGDYANMSVDPDGRTFWFTTEYVDDNTHGTRIVAFEFPVACTPPDKQATDFVVNSVTDNSVDISWTRGTGDRVLVVAREGSAVNTDPAIGTAYSADAQFGNGDQIGTGNYVVYDGTGTSVTVTGLESGATYYFAVYEYNADDYCYLTPPLTGQATTSGPPTVVTLGMESIASTSAVARGEVVSENGSAVTERGICWSTSPDPTLSDTHVAAGSGTGEFTATLDGLASSTTYYVRAYATNEYGTAYGNNVSFRTSCGIVTDFPYLQNFNEWAQSEPGSECTADGSVALSDCWQNQTGDDADWDVYSGYTPSAYTGPFFDANDWEGNYVYLEASDCFNKTASILTPDFDFRLLEKPELRFQYFMRGEDEGSLAVYVSTDGGATWSDAVWSVAGNQGMAWHDALVDLSDYAGFAQVKIKFTGTTGENYRSDIALDNVIVQEATGLVRPIYCEAFGNMDYNTAITGVVFNEISVSSGKYSPYNDFTTLKTGVRKGRTYSFYEFVNTDGDYTVYGRVYIDWNQDGDFDDDGESYDLGSATNVEDSLTDNSPLEITVPWSAKPGWTRMRVMVKYNDYPQACETEFDGEVEDYGVVVYDNCDGGVVQWNGNIWKTFSGDTIAPTDLADKYIYFDNLAYLKDSDIDACGAANKRANTAVIGSGHYIKLSADLQNGGYFEVRDDAALVQTDDASLIEGDGIYVVKRESQPLGHYYDYAYWSSPLQAGSFTLGEVVPGAWRYYAFDATQQVANTNPNPGWIQKQATDLMEAGKGYAISAPVSFQGGTLKVTFRKDGVAFGNGQVEVPVYINGQGADGGDDWNLIGNPYPSAVDFDALATQNADIQGSAYLWTNCAGLDSTGSHQGSGYSIYNLSGATAACAGAGPTAGRYIASGQAFMVEANANGTVTFSNTQRATQNDRFINRPSRSGIWLDFQKADTSSFKQILIAFHPSATEDYDRLYDAHAMNTTFYAWNGDQKYTIEGLPAWDGSEHRIPLGYTASSAGTYTISVNHTEGDLNDVHAYLLDRLTDRLYALAEGPYRFNTAEGTFDDRFVLVLSPRTLKDETIQTDALRIAADGKGHYTVSDARRNIALVEVYDITGKLITAQEVDGRHDVSLSLEQTAHQTLIFKITYTDGKQATKKVMR